MHLPLFLVEDSVACGELVEVLRDWRTKPGPVVYARTPHVAPKLRVFVDRIRSLHRRRHPRQDDEDPRVTRGSESVAGDGACAE